MNQTIYDYMVDLLGSPVKGFEWTYYLFGSIIILFMLTLVVRIIAQFLTGGR